MKTGWKMSLVCFAYLAVAGCNPFPNAKNQDPEARQGQEDVLSGKYGNETQQLAKEFDSLKNMSREDQLKRMEELRKAAELREMEQGK